METSADKKRAETFTDFLRQNLTWVLMPTVRFLDRMGIRPNMVTIAGLIGTTYGAYLVSQGNFFWGGFVMLAMGPVDALDGALARLRGEPQEFGAFVDSVSDRYADLVVYAGLVWFGLENDWPQLALASYFAAFGSVLVSYTRARAQSLGMEAKLGLFSRVERIVVQGAGLLFGYPYIAALIIAVGANFTAVQRILHVRQQARKRK